MKLMILILVFGCQNSLKTSKESRLTLNDSVLRISYIGNMGVLMENDDKTVLIDGFHEKYKPAYLHPSKGMVDSLIYGKYLGFSELELSLATHIHKDHFSPELALHFLRENKESLVIGPEQMKIELKKIAADADKLLDRVKFIDSENGTRSIQHQGIIVSSINCNHTYQIKHKNIQNVAYLIDINGYTILHVGDTDWNSAKSAFEKLKVVKSNVDIVILPFWMLTEKTSKNKVSELINPKMVIASHVDPNLTHDVVEEIQVSFPEAVVLTNRNKIIKFEKGR